MHRPARSGSPPRGRRRPAVGMRASVPVVHAGTIVGDGERGTVGIAQQRGHVVHLLDGRIQITTRIRRAVALRPWSSSGPSMTRTLEAQLKRLTTEEPRDERTPIFAMAWLAR